MWSLHSLLLPSINEGQKRSCQEGDSRSWMASQVVGQRAGDGRGCQQAHTCSDSAEWVAVVPANTAAQWELRYLIYSMCMEGHKCRRQRAEQISSVSSWQWVFVCHGLPVPGRSTQGGCVCICVEFCSHLPHLCAVSAHKAGCHTPAVPLHPQLKDLLCCGL